MEQFTVEELKARSGVAKNSTVYPKSAGDLGLIGDLGKIVGGGIAIVFGLGVFAGIIVGVVLLVKAVWQW